MAELLMKDPKLDSEFIAKAVIKLMKRDIFVRYKQTGEINDEDWEFCKEIDKACKKNPVLDEAVKRKMGEIVLNPSHYKPLRYDLAGERRVHILKSFVLRFEIDDTRKAVTFIAFEHHDDAYRR